LIHAGLMQPMKGLSIIFHLNHCLGEYSYK
jgi:hypothetical protein